MFMHVWIFSLISLRLPFQHMFDVVIIGMDVMVEVGLVGVIRDVFNNQRLNHGTLATEGNPESKQWNYLIIVLFGMKT